MQYPTRMERRFTGRRRKPAVLDSGCWTSVTPGGCCAQSGVCADTVVSLAVGIGANTTIFTIASALLFKPPAGVVEPGRLVDVGRSRDGQGFDNGSYPNYLDIRRVTPSLRTSTPIASAPSR